VGSLIGEFTADLLYLLEWITLMYYVLEMIVKTPMGIGLAAVV
jgi:hypothetical protein